MQIAKTPGTALARLLRGNARYVAGENLNEHKDPSRRTELACQQNPFAQVFGCADSRVPAEVVFDQGLGDLFVIRNAGHIVDSSVLGSIEFGIEALNIPLTLVLGHTSCGAVGATITAIDTHSTPSGYLRDVVERISPAVFEARRDPDAGYDDVVVENVRHTV
ncbi:carbonic anhydrase, partial [Dietzia sp. SLG510A3-3B2-2]|nr:carbonic anhydrase [Dietzia sp. SLG510A3-3B2-2]